MTILSDDSPAHGIAQEIPISPKGSPASVSGQDNSGPALYQVIGSCGEDSSEAVLGLFADLAQAISEVERYRIEVCSYLFTRCRDIPTSFGDSLAPAGTRCILQIEAAALGFLERGKVLWTCVYESTREQWAPSTWKVVTMTPSDSLSVTNPWQWKSADLPGNKPVSDNSNNAEEVRKIIPYDDYLGPVARRRLRLYFLLDCSSSMGGDRIDALNMALRDMLHALQDIESREVVDVIVSVIKFSDMASWHIGPGLPLADARSQWQDLQVPNSEASAGRSFAAALRLLLPELSIEKLGAMNLPPLMLLVSNGHCSDPVGDYESVLAELDSSACGKKSVRVSMGIGASDKDYDKAKLDAFMKSYIPWDQNLTTFRAENLEIIGEVFKDILALFTQSYSSLGQYRSRVSIPQPPHRIATPPDPAPDPWAVF